MQFSEAVKLALQSLWANKLRSVLTLIGVVMGVASVIMVITLTNTANNYMGTKLSGYGADVFTIARDGLIFGPDDYARSPTTASRPPTPRCAATPMPCSRSATPTSPWAAP
jgi:putative ABC transport system permease protein